MDTKGLGGQVHGQSLLNAKVAPLLSSECQRSVDTSAAGSALPVGT